MKKKQMLLLVGGCTALTLIVVVLLILKTPIFQLAQTTNTEEAAESIDEVQATIPPLSEVEPMEAEESQAFGNLLCPDFEILAVDIREDFSRMPNTIVSANSEVKSSPEGFQVSYSSSDGIQAIGDSSLLITSNGTSISASSSIPVRCVGIFLEGDHISAFTLAINGEVVWNGAVDDESTQDQTKFYYLRGAVIPPRPTTITITGIAEDTQEKVFIPITFFGFDIP